MNRSLFVLCGLFCLLRPAAADELKATLGRPQTIMRSGQHGFNYFPDEPISIISERPLRFLMVVGNQTVLMEGRTFDTAQPVRVVLAPSNKPGTYDEHYAGISSVYIDRCRKDVLGFFHAEKPTGGKNDEGTTRFYATIGLAVSRDGGLTFTKVGPILTGRPEDPNWKGTAQGNADVSVTVDHTGKWLYAYYTEHSRRDPSSGKQRSVITCMARSLVSDGGRPGTWKKFYNGSFSEPGLGGRDSEVANCWAPHVSYIPQMKKYAMMGNRGCVGFYTSDDGIHWGSPTILFKMTDVPMLGKEIAIHPSLHVQRATATSATGMLFYAYSPNYGHQPPASPHYFAGRPITLRLDSASEDDGNAAASLKTRLAGTKWVNSNNVSFEWTRDGRFLHKGTERQWRILDANRVQIVFGPNHVDTLVFDDGLKEFKQIIRGGSESFQGKRR